jgi:hypothetical protein
MVKVLEPIPEDIKTKNSSIPLVIEDVLLETITFLNAESTVDQTKVTNPLKLMLNAQEHHGDHTMSRLVKNSESLEKVGLKEEAEEHGDH